MKEFAAPGRTARAILDALSGGARTFPQESDKDRTIARAAAWSMADNLADPQCYKHLRCPLIPPGQVRQLLTSLRRYCRSLPVSL